MIQDFPTEMPAASSPVEFADKQYGVPNGRSTKDLFEDLKRQKPHGPIIIDPLPCDGHGTLPLPDVKPLHHLINECYGLQLALGDLRSEQNRLTADLNQISLQQPTEESRAREIGLITQVQQSGELIAQTMAQLEQKERLLQVNLAQLSILESRWTRFGADRPQVYTPTNVKMPFSGNPEELIRGLGKKTDYVSSMRDRRASDEVQALLLDDAPLTGSGITEPIDFTFDSTPRSARHADGGLLDLD